MYLSAASHVGKKYWALFVVTETGFSDPYITIFLIIKFHANFGHLRTVCISVGNMRINEIFFIDFINKCIQSSSMVLFQTAIDFCENEKMVEKRAILKM